MMAGGALALAFVFDLADTLPMPFAGHLLLAAGFFALAASLHCAFLVELSRSKHLAHSLVCALDGGLAMLVWGLGARTLVRAICALLAVGSVP
jgi:hypothetical protein